MIGELAELAWFPAITNSLDRTFRQEAVAAARWPQTGQAAPRTKVCTGFAALGSCLVGDITALPFPPPKRQLGTPTELSFCMRAKIEIGRV